MTGFFAATIGELITGKGAIGQLALETNLPPGVIKVREPLCTCCFLCIPDWPALPTVITVSQCIPCCHAYFHSIKLLSLFSDGTPDPPLGSDLW